ncbi:MAG: DUF4293 domain-containing protein [Prevotella sp.]|nr:DUF4293 domain-containing protein [Bacteroides sp.]MCM1365688.1 DUF4293 domain-containing protein [Prevotella sp.]MCM1437142.1 DUF4293 domain-containing protein [Prevotella sp.]
MVIQRWQSVLLLCACALMACFSFASIGQIQTTDFTYNISSLGLTYEGDATQGAPTGYQLHTWYFFAVSIMGAIIPAIAIFCFRNLKLQKRLCLVELMFIIASSVIAVSVGYCTVDGGDVEWSSVVCCPILSLVATVMAYNRINKDHKLLQSVDRLR